MAMIDSHYFGGIVIAPLNIVLYNVFTEHGPDLYGNKIARLKRVMKNNMLSLKPDVLHFFISGVTYVLLLFFRGRAMAFLHFQRISQF